MKGLDPREMTTYADAGRLMDVLEQVFRDLNLDIPAHCGLAEIWLEASEMENRRLGKTPVDLTKDMRPTQRRIVGLLHLASLIVRAHRRADAVHMKDHLRLVTTCSFAQNVKAISDEGSNKVFELLMGLVASEVGTNVDMDSPRHAQGDNPDVLFKFQARRWAIACKVVNGVSPLTLFERIEEGIRQIEVSAADVGVVAINMKNVLEHDDFWPILRYEDGEPVYGVHKNYMDAVQRLVEFANLKHTELVDSNSLAEVNKLFQGKKAVPAVLLFLQTTAGVSLKGRSLPTNLGVLSLMRFGTIQANDILVLEAMNDALHNRFTK